MRTSTRHRQDRILEELYHTGHVLIKDLAKLLEVSQATVRRDLRALTHNGNVELMYGGAALLRNTDYSFRSKATRNTEAKRAIGRLAAALVAEGDQVFLDSGTTCFEILPHLKRKRGLSVVTNSERLALELDIPGIKVILLGGQYRPERMDTIGPLAMSTLEQLRGYLAFIGADGLSTDFGLTASDIESAHLYRLAVRNARETVLVVDRSKFEKPSLFRIVSFETISRIVTDKYPGDDWFDFLNARGIDVVLPDSEVQHIRRTGRANVRKSG